MKKFTEQNTTENIYHYKDDNTFQLVLEEPNTGLLGASWSKKDLNNDKKAYIEAKKKALENLNEDFPKLIEFCLKHLTPLEVLSMLQDKIINLYADTDQKTTAVEKSIDFQISLKKLER